MANVYLVLFTYANSVKGPRAEYARRTLESALKNLRTDHVLKVHIADDGSDLEHVQRLIDICEARKVPCQSTDANRRGYGASFNLATQHAHWDGDYFLMLEDDWELTREFNIDPVIESLDAGLGCVRLGYIGWTQELYGSIKKYADMTFLEFDPESPEPHVWSGHPRLETREFQRRVGPWPEGLDPGSTEFSVAHYDEARKGVAWPLDLGTNASQQYCSLFAHIGSIQARSDQEVSHA